MLATLRAWPYISEADDFDIEGAIYWFANDYHGGQWSNLYSALSTSEFRPGPLANGPEPESMEADLYAELVATYFPDDVPAEDTADA